MSISKEPLFVRLLAQSPLARRELNNLIETAPSRYKEHYIDKRNGRGRRLISQPTAELKFFQRLLANVELSHLPVHESAKAYRAHHSIKDHALPHARSKYVLKLDFTNFFPSLSADAVKRILTIDGHYNDAEQWIACQILCRRRLGEVGLHLTIGAPSSPFISNALMFEFDQIVADYCRTNYVVYTRYADDIALSTSEPGRLNVVYAFVRGLTVSMSHLCLSLNNQKTVNVSRKYRRTLTGLTLANDGTVSVGRGTKRILRAAIHSLANGKIPELPVSRLRGILAFLYSVDREWVVELCKRHGFATIKEIELKSDS